MTKLFCVSVLTYLYAFQVAASTNIAVESFGSDSSYILVELFKQVEINSSLVGANCLSHMNILRDSLDTRKIWAIKALEATAITPSNFLYGNDFWMGSKQECLYISNPRSPTLQKYYTALNQHIMQIPNEMKFVYKVARADYHSSLQTNTSYLKNADILHVGLCLPKSCNNEDTKSLIEAYFSEKNRLVNDLYDLTINKVWISDLELNSGFFLKKTFIALCLVFLSTIAITLLSTCSKNSGEKSSFTKIVQSFSPVANLSFIYDTKPSGYPEMNGCRLISSLWILSFHMQFFSFYKITSRFSAFVLAEEIQLTFVTSGPIFVEVFFVISAILLTCSYLKNETQTDAIARYSTIKSISFIIEMFFKRLIRIGPLYFVVILMSEVTGSYFTDTAPIELYEKNDRNCQNYWWRNILFIQNFYPFNELCLNWSWTLACDVQNFLMTTIVYVIYCKNKKLGKLIFGMIATFFLISSTYMIIYYEFQATFDIYLTTLDTLYLSPFSRAPPYIIGTILGYVMVKKNTKMTKNVWNAIWIVVMGITIFGFGITNYRSAPIWVASPIIAVGKWVFPVCLAWWCLSGSFGHQNFITHILSHPMLQHFGKISYAYYLLNPYLIIYINAWSDFPLDMDPVLLTVFTIGVVVLTYFFSVLFTILFEMPYTNLLKIYSSKNQAKG